MFDAPPVPGSVESETNARAEYLRTQLREAAARYHNFGTSPLTDESYDELARELAQLEAEHPHLAAPDSPLTQVGAPLPEEAGKRTRHLTRMLSLPNAMSDEEVSAWHGRMQRHLGTEEPITGYTVEPKIDGLSLSLRYVGGRLDRATTRGNGEEGEDWTPRVLLIPGIPHTLPTDAPTLIEIRGETVLHAAAMEHLNQLLTAEGGETYDNPRNAAVGILRNEDVTDNSAAHLSFYCYGAALPNDALLAETQGDLLDRLVTWGFSAPPTWLRARSLEEASAAAADILATRVTYPFALDGAVIKVDSIHRQRELGSTGKDPRWATARKERGQSAITRCIGIDAGLGRTGAITPRAILEPVLCGGVMVAAATLHNEEEVKRLDLRIGDMCVLERRGDVIPKIVHVLPERRDGSERPWAFPTECPSCGDPISRPVVRIRTSRDREGDQEVLAANYYCDSPTCADMIVARLEHFATRDAMEIEGLGPKVAAMLSESGLVRSVADLYDLRADQLACLDGFAHTRAENLVAAIAATCARPFHRVLIALGVRHVGRTVSAKLAECFGTMDALLDAPVESVAAIDGVGPVIARAWRGWAQAEPNRTLVARLAAAGLQMEAARRASAAAQPLAGQTVVVTGTLESMSRTEAEQRLKDAGARVSGSVSAKTTFVLAGREAGSKRDKAEKLGIQIISETELETMLTR